MVQPYFNPGTSPLPGGLIQELKDGFQGVKDDIDAGGGGGEAGGLGCGPWEVVASRKVADGDPADASPVPMGFVYDPNFEWLAFGLGITPDLLLTNTVIESVFQLEEGGGLEVRYLPDGITPVNAGGRILPAFRTPPRPSSSPVTLAGANGPFDLKIQSDGSFVTFRSSTAPGSPFQYLVLARRRVCVPADVSDWEVVYAVGHLPSQPPALTGVFYDKNYEWVAAIFPGITPARIPASEFIRILVLSRDLNVSGDKLLTDVAYSPDGTTVLVQGSNLGQATFIAAGGSLHTSFGTLFLQSIPTIRLNSTTGEFFIDTFGGPPGGNYAVIARRKVTASSAGGGPPGVWTKLGQGPTTVPFGSDVTVLSVPIVSGEVTGFEASPLDVGSPQSIQESASGSFLNYYRRRNGPNIEFHLANIGVFPGVPVTFDWVAWKVVP